MCCVVGKQVSEQYKQGSPSSGKKMYPQKKQPRIVLCIFYRYQRVHMYVNTRGL